MTPSGKHEVALQEVQVIRYTLLQSAICLTYITLTRVVLSCDLLETGKSIHQPFCKVNKKMYNIFRERYHGDLSALQPSVLFERYKPLQRPLALSPNTNYLAEVMEGKYFTHLIC